MLAHFAARRCASILDFSSIRLLSAATRALLTPHDPAHFERILKRRTVDAFLPWVTH